MIPIEIYINGRDYTLALYEVSDLMGKEMVRVEYSYAHRDTRFVETVVFYGTRDEFMEQVKEYLDNNKETA